MKKNIKILMLFLSLILTIFMSSIQISATTYKTGDINRDSVVDSNDAIYLLRHTLDPSKYPIECSHSIVKHDKKSPTCTEYGWNEYETCQLCDYSTYKELDPLGHNEINHAPKSPCTDIGWDSYVTCSRCDYSTYRELPVQGHCFEDYICINCGETNLDIWDGSTDISWFNSNEDVFFIQTAEQFAGIYTLVDAGETFNDKKINLCTNIDLNRKEWLPIGTSGRFTFMGTLDGCNYVIKNLKITDASPKYIGLFGYFSGTIKNLGIENVDFDLSSPNSIYVGSLIGYSYDGTITNCYAKGEINTNVTETGLNYSGGLIGQTIVYKDDSTQKSYADVIVSAYSNTNQVAAGGLIGSTDTYSDVDDCYATGNVHAFSSSGNSYGGGLIGIQNGRTYRCFATGNIEVCSTKNIAYGGGLTGYSTSLYNCYAVGDVMAKTSSDTMAYIGGLAGKGASNAVFSTSYRNQQQKFSLVVENNTITTPTNTSGIEKSLSTIKTISFHTNALSWSTAIWHFENNCYPILSWQKHPN